METTLKISGMSCGHCIRAVKEALGGLEGISVLEVNLDQGTAKITHTYPLDQRRLHDVLDAEGYELVSG